ncbi:hypothetical protein CDL15_Pgr008099 [Punica granatum]|nr:hypothetical protein CDL15_Pgr008099 [Punica granatum]
MSNWIDSRQDDGIFIQLSEENEDNEFSDTRNDNDYWIDQLPRGQEYWHARRAFLSSYHFSEDRTRFAGKLKRSVKGMNKAAMGVVLEVRQELSKRRFVIRVFRVKLIFPSMVHICVKCFVPSFRKVEKLSH